MNGLYVTTSPHLGPNQHLSGGEVEPGLNLAEALLAEWRQIAVEENLSVCLLGLHSSWSHQSRYE